MIAAVYIGCADDRRRIIRVNSNDALRSSAHPMISEPYRVTLAHLTGCLNVLIDSVSGGYLDIDTVPKSHQYCTIHAY